MYRKQEAAYPRRAVSLHMTSSLASNLKSIWWHVSELAQPLVTSDKETRLQKRYKGGASQDMIMCSHGTVQHVRGVPT